MPPKSAHRIQRAARQRLETELAKLVRLPYRLEIFRSSYSSSRDLTGPFEFLVDEAERVFGRWVRARRTEAGYEIVAEYSDSVLARITRGRLVRRRST